MVQQRCHPKDQSAAYQCPPQMHECSGFICGSSSRRSRFRSEPIEVHSTGVEGQTDSRRRHSLRPSRCRRAASAIQRAIGRPRPAPDVVDRAGSSLTNRSNTRSRSAAGMPGPASDTVIDREFANRIACDADDHRPAPRRVLNGVAQQVRGQLPKQVVIAVDRAISRLKLPCARRSLGLRRPWRLPARTA